MKDIDDAYDDSRDVYDELMSAVEDEGRDAVDSGRVIVFEQSIAWSDYV